MKDSKQSLKKFLKEPLKNETAVNSNVNSPLKRTQIRKKKVKFRFLPVYIV